MRTPKKITAFSLSPNCWLTSTCDLQFVRAITLSTIQIFFQEHVLKTDMCEKDTGWLLKYCRENHLTLRYLLRPI